MPHAVVQERHGTKHTLQATEGHTGHGFGESRGTHSGGLQLGDGAEFEALEEEGADGGVDGVECEGEEAGDRHVWWDNVPEEAEDGGEGVLRAREREERRVPQNGLERHGIGK